MNYMHENPVKAGYVEKAEDYRRTIARLIIAGNWSGQTASFIVMWWRVLDPGPR
jgi:hypothetical protein